MKMSIRIILGVLSLAANLGQASEYDPLLMRAQASIYPKITLLDKAINSKQVDGKLQIAIVHTAEDHNVAHELKIYIEQASTQAIQVSVVSYKAALKSPIASAYVLLKGAKNEQNAIAMHAAKQGRIAFCYDYNDMNNGVLIGMSVREKTYIYLNKPASHDYNVSFQPVFYKIIKVTE